MDTTKDYVKYRTFFALTEESIVEYETLMQPDPIHGIDVHVALTISSQESESGVEKELDVTVAGETKRIVVEVPKGMENGKYIRYREKGEPGKFGGQNGDLYVRVVVEPVVEEKEEPEQKESPVDGRDINCTLTITNEEWVKGVEKEKEVTIDGIKKRILVKVPPAIQNGAAIRYKGKGEAGKFGGQNGDLYVRVVVSKEKADNQYKENEPPVPNSENTIPINITFLEAVKGTEKEIILPQKITETPFGKVSSSAPQKISIKIPAGIDEGQFLRIKKNSSFDYKENGDFFNEFFGKADKSNNKNKITQDWYVEIHIDKHPKFERKGYDIYSTEHLPFYIGAGRQVKIDTLDGQQYYNIEKGTKDGDQICLKNKGIPNLNNSSVRGNHYVTWKKK